MNSFVLQDLETLRVVARSVFIAGKIDRSVAQAEKALSKSPTIKKVLLVSFIFSKLRKRGQHTESILPAFPQGIAPGKQIVYLSLLLLVLGTSRFKHRQSFITLPFFKKEPCTK